MKNFETFLKKIGVKSDMIIKLSSDEDIQVDELAKSWKDSWKEVLSNDPEFIQPIKDEIKGTELSKMEHKIKKTFGLTSDEIKDKKFEEILALAQDKSKTTSSSTSDELQTKIMELTRENKKLMEEVIPQKEQEAKDVIKTYKKDIAIKSILGSKSLIVKPEVVYPAIQSHLNSFYDIDMNDDGSWIVKTKAGLNPLNQDGTKVMSFEEILETQLKDLNVIKQSNGTPDPTTTRARTQTLQAEGGEAKFHLPGLKAAQENVDKMSQMRTFGK